MFNEILVFLTRAFITPKSPLLAALWSIVLCLVSAKFGSKLISEKYFRKSYNSHSNFSSFYNTSEQCFLSISRTVLPNYNEL